MRVLFRCSRADYSILCGPIWSKFQLILDIMHVLDTYKFKIDQMKSKREKRQLNFFRGSRTANSMVQGWIWLNFKLIQALMYFIVTCKYEKDLKKNSSGKMATPFFPL